jgi:hypothetical protein
MPPMIEFNEKARPPMAKPFGGTLEIGKFYKLRNGYVIRVINKGNGLNSPVDWRFAEFCNGPLKGSQKWWNMNGLFQGMEMSIDYKYHVTEECGEPENVLDLQLGKCYVTKAGWKTTMMVFASIHDPEVGGPVFSCRLVKPDGTLSVKCQYNMMGHYLGGASIQWPQGNKESGRSIVALADTQHLNNPAATLGAGQFSAIKPPEAL